MVKAFSRPGKIRGFEKKAKIGENSGNLKKHRGKNIQHATHTLSCEGAVHGFCLIVGVEGVAMRGGMGPHINRKNIFFQKKHIFSVGHWSCLLHVNAGKSWKNQGI